MAHKQPQIIGTLGDIHPLEYSGGVILDHGDSHPTLVWFEPQSENESSPIDVYHVALDKRQVLGDVETRQDVFTLSHYTNQIPWGELADSAKSGFHACPYAPREYTEWYDGSIEDIAKCNDQTVEELRRLECSESPQERAWFYYAVAGYYGWHELTGGDVDTERSADLRKRWALRFWRARQKGITVYS